MPLPAIGLEGDWVIGMGTLVCIGALGVVDGPGEVGMVSFACYYSVKLMPKKGKKHAQFPPRVKSSRRSGVLWT